MQDHEEFDLVLGKRQVMSLFFVVVVFFAVFFSAGYLVGFGHGEGSEPPPQLASASDPDVDPDEIRLPDRLLKPSQASPGTSTGSTSAGSPPNSTTPAATTRKAPPPAKKPEPRTVAASPAPKPTAARTAPKPPPTQTTAARPTPAKPTPRPAQQLQKPRPAAASSSSHGQFLQVAASRVRQDADMLAGKLEARGYAARVLGDKGDGWNRVVVGPFADPAAAEPIKRKLNDDGFDTMLRKF